MVRARALVLLFLLILSPLARALDLDLVTQDTEKYLEQKIQRQLSLLYPNIPAVASVKIRGVNKPPPAPKDKPKNDKDKDKEKDKDKPKDGKDKAADKEKSSVIDYGYVPFPVDPNDTSSKPSLLHSDGLHFDDTLVLLEVDPRVEEAMVKGMKESIIYALEGYNPQVTIKKFGSPTPKIFQPTPEPNPGAAPSDKSDASNPKESSSRLTGIFQLISFLLLAAALVFLSIFVRRGADAVAGGIRALGGKKKGEEEEATKSGKFTIGGDSSPFPIKLPLDVAASYERNMVTIRRALELTPDIVAQELQSTPEDASGLRWLLPALEPKEQEALRTSLGPGKTRQLLAMASAVGTQADPDFLEARYLWLQHFVERLALRHLRGSSPVDAALGNAMILQLSAINVVDIERWLMTREDAASWRVATEFVPADRLGRLLEKMDGSKWQLVARAAGASMTELRQAAKSLVEERSEKDPANAQQLELRKDYFQRILADPLTSALKQLTMEDQEAMLNALETENPDLIRSLEDRFWSLRHLRRVSAESLNQTFRDLGTEEKTYLIAALPKDDARRFLDLLPEGNVKIIVQDRVEKMRKRKDKQEMATVSAFAQRFMERLRQRNLAGELELMPLAAEPQVAKAPPPKKTREAA